MAKPKLQEDLLLIDADYTCYAAASGAEVEVEWDQDTWSVYGDLKRGKEKFKRRLESYQEDTGVEEFKLCYTEGENWRKLLNPEYKSHRGRKPCGYRALKEWSMEEYPHFVKDGLEADDCMGILATKFPGRCVIVTIDKDMKTIPGRMLHLKQQGKPEWIVTTEAEANFAWLSQSISGDRTDGYPGIEGMGPAKAAKLLQSKGAVYKTVEDAYIAAGLTKEDALMNTRMARILRAEDWDFMKSEMKLWAP